MTDKARLGSRILRSTGWEVSGLVVQNLLRLCSNLIMTRILMPDAFGMIALASTVMSAIILSTDIGIHRSIIREPDGEDPHFLRVAWVVKILRNFIVAVLVLFAAALLWLLQPYVSGEDTIYARPEMVGLIAMVALVPILTGFVSTNFELAMRRIERKPIVIINLTAQVCSILAMVGFSQYSPSVWALMCGMLINNVVVCVLSHFWLSGVSMRFEWDREIVQRLWLFGRWIMGSSLLNFISQNIDKILLAGFLGPISFGLYVIAQIWYLAGRTILFKIIDSVGYSALSEISRNRRDELPSLYRRFQNRLDLICLAMFAVTYAIGPKLIEVLYQSTYYDAGTYLQLMSIGFLFIRSETLSQLVLSSGNSFSILVASSVRAVASTVLVPVGFWVLEIPGAIFGLMFAQLCAVPYIFYLAGPMIGAEERNKDVLIMCGLVLLGVGAMVLT